MSGGFGFGLLDTLSAVRASGTAMIDISFYEHCRPGNVGEFRRGNDVQRFIVRRRRRTADGLSVKVWMDLLSES